MTLSLYTPKEACAEFQMDITTIYRHLHRGNIRHIRVGGLFRVIPDGFLEQDITALYPQRFKVKELCGILKLSLPSVYNLVRTDDFPVDHYGRILRVPRDGFFSWLRHSSASPAKEISVENVSSYINDIISGGIYYGQ